MVVILEPYVDATLRRLKNASQSKQEAARLEVENAEDDLVQKTEVAITLMKTVLENVRNREPSLSAIVLIFRPQPEPLKNLNELAKAQVSQIAFAFIQTPSHSFFCSSCSTLLPPSLSHPYKARLRSSVSLQRANTGASYVYSIPLNLVVSFSLVLIRL